MPEIPITELRKKLEELDTLIQKATKEKEHLEYVLRTFAPDQDQQALFPDAQALTKRGSKLTTVIEILQANRAPMRSAEIHKELQSRGMNMPKPTFDAYMSEWIKMKEPKIQRVTSGIYALSEHAAA